MMLTLKQFRAKYKLTQKELAKSIGTTPTTIFMYETEEQTGKKGVDEEIRRMRQRV